MIASRLLSVCAISVYMLAQRPPVAEMPAFPPKTKFEPSLAAAAKSLAESTAASPKELLTLAEKTNYAETARYSESLALAKRMEKASPWIKVVMFGKSPQGRDLFAVVVSKDRAFTPAAAQATGKAIILLESCIHPGEVDGREASEMLLRDVAINKRYAAWLDSVILVNIPIFNVDGHERFGAFNRINQDGPKEMGFRATAQRLNLNRDFIKADAPEMKAWLKFFNAWLPDFFIDNHVTDGADFQYDVTIDTIQNQEIWPTVGRWVSERYLPYLNDSMATDGHLMGWYGGPVDRSDPAKGFAKSTYTPRFSHGYMAVQNRPALLVETHSLKSFKTRTWAHYDIMKRSIESIVRDPEALRTAVREADKAVAALAGTSTELYLDGKLDTAQSAPYTFRTLKASRKQSDLAGGPITVYEKDPLDIQTKIFTKVTTTTSASIPAGYIVPSEWLDVIERLELHGIKTERLAKEIEVNAEVYQLSNVKFAPMPFEGRFGVSFDSHKLTKKRRFPAGSVWVPIPEMKKEFDERVAQDAAFAKNPRARVAWWFERSPYYEPDKDEYPVVRVIKKTW